MKLLSIINENMQENFIYRGFNNFNKKVSNGEILTFNTKSNEFKKYSNAYNTDNFIEFFRLLNLKIKIPTKQLAAYFSGDFNYANSYAYGVNKFVGKLIAFDGEVIFNKDIEDSLTSFPYIDFPFSSLLKDSDYLKFIIENINNLEIIKNKFFWLQNRKFSGKLFVKNFLFYKKYLQNLKKYNLGDKVYKCEYIITGNFKVEVIKK